MNNEIISFFIKDIYFILYFKIIIKQFKFNLILILYNNYISNKHSLNFIII